MRPAPWYVMRAAPQGRLLLARFSTRQFQCVRRECRGYVGWLLLKAPAQQPPDAFRSLGRQPAPIWFGLQHLGENLANRFALEDRTPGEHFVKYASECPHIRSALHVVPFRLLGRHIGRRSQNHFGAGRRQQRGGVRQTRNIIFALAHLRQPKSNTFTCPDGVIITYPASDRGE
jgi:hypothetical protein